VLVLISPELVPAFEKRGKMTLYAYGIIDIDETNNVYTFGSHQYALYFWLKCLEQGLLRKHASLIHIDFHSDFLNPLSSINKEIDSLNVESLINRRQIHNDNFIKIALSLGLIKDIKFCCKPEWGEFNNVKPFQNFLSPIIILDALKKHVRLNDADIILDIDLDFFIDFKSETIKLKERSQIENEIRAINELFKYAKVTTICTSQDWSWRKEQREKVQKIFCDNFIYKVNFSKNPVQIY